MSLIDSNAVKNGLADFWTGFRYGGYLAMGDLEKSSEIMADDLKTKNNALWVLAGHGVRCVLELTVVDGALKAAKYARLYNQNRLGIVSKDGEELKFKDELYKVKSTNGE